jgi:hypothetical protein
MGDEMDRGLMVGQNGKQGELKDLNAAALQAQADASKPSS